MDTRSGKRSPYAKSPAGVTRITPGWSIACGQGWVYVIGRPGSHVGKPGSNTPYWEGENGIVKAKIPAQRAAFREEVFSMATATTAPGVEKKASHKALWFGVAI